MKESAWRSQIKRLYGLEYGDYQKIYQQQDGKCALCKRPQIPETHLAVDHDHKTGMVRGLLCQQCNRILGYFENQEWTKDAFGYLLRSNFPYGHQKFIPTCLNQIELHSLKNFDYAHGGNPLGNFYRVAAILKQYPGLDPGDPAVVAIIYMLKQLDAALWLKAQGHEAKVQGAGERWDDTSVYANIIQLIEEENENDKSPKR